MRSVRVIGPGRVGQSFMAALAEVGWQVLAPIGRGGEVASAGEGADLVLITTPDHAIGEVARGIRAEAGAGAEAERAAAEARSTAEANGAAAAEALATAPAGPVIAHASGALTLDVLGPHRRRASLHPLVSIPGPAIGAVRLRSCCAFAVDGDALACEVVTDLGGRAFRVPPERRVAYHTAAVVASNHLVALMGQVERLAAVAGVPLDAYLELARQTLDNVGRLGPAAALTGPVARGDWDTVSRHLAALDPSEVAAYQVMVDQAQRLLERPPATKAS